MSNADELALIRECLAGNDEAFGTIVDRYQGVVFNTAYGIVSDYEEARDIAQTVFMKVYQNLDRFKPRHKLFSWIYRMTVNESINVAKKLDRGQQLSDQLIAPQPSPEERAVALDLQDKVMKALQTMAVHYRVVIVLRHFRDLSYSEISEILSIPVKTVKSRLFTARRLLAGIVAEQGVVAHE
jgi:RNA polymerase sigma-70 factor (ECF subfamily)